MRWRCPSKERDLCSPRISICAPRRRSWRRRRSSSRACTADRRGALAAARAEGLAAGHAERPRGADGDAGAQAGRAGEHRRAGSPTRGRRRARRRRIRGGARARCCSRLRRRCLPGFARATAAEVRRVLRLVLPGAARASRGDGAACIPSLTRLRRADRPLDPRFRAAAPTVVPSEAMATATPDRWQDGRRGARRAALLVRSAALHPPGRSAAAPFPLRTRHGAGRPTRMI